MGFWGFGVLGISVALGLVVGLSGRRKRSSSKQSSTDDSGSGSGNSGFSSLLMSELKRMAAKRAMMYISDIVDRKVMPEIRRTDSGQAEDSAHQTDDL